MNKNLSQVAMLFDLDGTMVDTDHLHLNAYNQLLKRFGRKVSWEYYKTKIMGFPNDAIMLDLFEKASALEHSALANEKEELFRVQLAKLFPTTGLVELLDWAESHRVPVAVVTNAPRANATQLLKGLGLSERFEVVIIGEELPHGKPHPLPYLTALQRVQISADRAVAFEDSLSGVRSASSAGIRTFGMLTSLPESALRDAGAFDVLKDFSEEKILNCLCSL